MQFNVCSHFGSPCRLSPERSRRTSTLMDAKGLVGFIPEERAHPDLALKFEP